VTSQPLNTDRKIEEMDMEFGRVGFREIGDGERVRNQRGIVME